MGPYADWWRAHRRRLGGRGMALDGGEPGRPAPAEFDSSDVRLLICRLSSYPDVLSSITHRLLFWAARQVPGVYVDLAFFPSASDAALLTEGRVPWWLASGAKRAPRDFDIVAVNLTVQQEALNLPAALAHSGLRLDHSGRMDDPGHPLVILGGHAAASAPFLHGDAAGGGSGGLVDAVCVGDGVLWLQSFLRRFAEARSRGIGKREFLRGCADALPGTYVPALYRHRHEAGRLAAIEPSDAGLPFPVAYNAEPPASWLNGYDGAYIPFARADEEETLPLSSGCAFRCRFCQSGWVRGAPAESDAAAYREAARRLKAHTAASDLNLLAADACSVRDLADRVRGLLALFERVSVKSLAVASVARSPELRAMMRRLEKREFAFGVEGVSARLRAYLGKQAGPAPLAAILHEFAATGLRQVKLFFIVTGLEDESDLDEYAEFLGMIRHGAPSVRLICSFMPLFLAPFTPLQFAALPVVRPEIAGGLSQRTRRAGAEFRWSAGGAEIRLMSRLCRAGRAATPLLVRWSLEHGIAYREDLAEGAVKRATAELAESGLDMEWLDAERGEDAVLPWDDVASGTPRSVLWNAWVRAQEVWAGGPDEQQEPRAVASSSAPAAWPERLDAGTMAVFATRLQPDDGLRPDVTLARRALRDLFARWPAGVEAYLGSPSLLRFPDSSGLALVRARFRTGAVVGVLPLLGPQFPSGSMLNVECSALDVAPVFAVRVSCALDPLLAALRKERVSFQTVRRDGARWHIVGPTYRHRAGLWAAVEPAEGGPVLFAAASFAGHHVEAVSDAAAPETLAILSAGDRCPRCGAATLSLRHGDLAVTLPPCLPCG